MLFIPTLGELKLVNINVETIIASVVTAGIVGYASTYFTLIVNNAELRLQIKSMAETLKEFTGTVAVLTKAVNEMAHFHGDVQNIFDRLADLEQEQARTAAQVEMLMK
jgi:hypothetical protein